MLGGLWWPSGTSGSAPALGAGGHRSLWQAPYSHLGGPQRIVCGARSPLLRDLLLSCKLGLFTPNKAGDYLPGKQPIDGGGQRAEAEGCGEQGGGWYRNQALPGRLVIHQQERPSDLLAGDDLGGGREESGAPEGWWGAEMLNRQHPQPAAPRGAGCTSPCLPVLPATSANSTGQRRGLTPGGVKTPAGGPTPTDLVAPRQRLSQGSPSEPPGGRGLPQSHLQTHPPPPQGVIPDGEAQTLTPLVFSCSE